MLVRSLATVSAIVVANESQVELVTEYGPALAYTALVGSVSVGDVVLLNRTARVLGLGTGGYDIVISISGSASPPNYSDDGHIVKLRYSPSQVAVRTLEEHSELSDIWSRDLAGLPIVVCQLHSQIAHVAAALAHRGKRCVYVMTDTGSLVCSFSQLLSKLKAAGLISASISAGQAFGGDYETVTVHSALLAAKYYLDADAIVVGQGPGNAGTGTTYGFSGIDQAGQLDIAAALNGEPIAVIRASSGDSRERHQGVSHHSLTTLRLVRSSCAIPIPAGMIMPEMDIRHRVVPIMNTENVIDYLLGLDIDVTSMGRNVAADRVFFECAAAAGLYACGTGDS